MTLRFGLAGLLALTVMGCAVTPPASLPVPDAAALSAVPEANRPLLLEGIRRGLFTFGTQQKGAGTVSGGAYGIEFGSISGVFQSVANLGVEMEVVEHKIITRGAKDAIIRAIPGRLRWSNVRLSRGITANRDVWNWMQQVTEGRVDTARLNGTITQYDQSATPVAEWELRNAWPMKLTAGSDSGTTTGSGVEELTLVHEGLKRTK